ncbi:MAG TPA: c-type cytochrome [Pirellulales bacterium]|nr:c-type cytochrome [Pirellulales bacterium]
MVGSGSARACNRRPGARCALVGLIVLIALLPAGCDLPGQPDPNLRSEGRALTGPELFQTHCAGCHGAEGKLGPAPPLNDSLFAKIMPRDELLRVIAHGRPGTPMPAFSRESGGPLSKEQIGAITWPHTGGQPSNATTPDWLRLDRPIAAGDAKRGAAAFNRACAPCHGDHGEGTEGAGAINDLAFLEITSDQLLRRLIITGRPDLDMPDYRSPDGRDDDFQPLDEKDINDLVALLAAWRRGETIESD